MPEVLKYFGIPMVLWIPIDLLPAKGREWPFMNHEELMELLDSWLFEVQSHSLTHSVMSAISNESKIQEICGSKWKLEDQFHRPINTFVYPWGKYNSNVLKVVEECGYRFGLTTEFGTNTVSDLQKNPYRLKRTRITRELDLEEYFSIFNR
jgi:peptidoglycan/xylan/chitin deacetylase (PgdA/CDA1 family)